MPARWYLVVVGDPSALAFPYDTVLVTFALGAILWSPSAALSLVLLCIVCNCLQRRILSLPYPAW